MITYNLDGTKELDIFRNFKRDLNLPKYKKEDVNKNESSFIVQTGFTTGTNSNVFVSSSGGTFGSFTVEQNSSVNSVNKKTSFLDKIKNIFSRKKVDVRETYKVIFKSLQELKEFNSTSSRLQDELTKAKMLNQTALYEKLVDNIKIKMYENQLVSLKQFKYISESKLIEFSENCEKGLRLDWVSNFSRTIPDEVSNNKLKLDEYKIFDNYVVFHYDPEGKSTALTKEEIAKKKDPILFGVIENSRNLYYIGDWIDDYCDLTFDKLIEEFSKTQLKLKPHVN